MGHICASFIHSRRSGIPDATAAPTCSCPSAAAAGSRADDSKARPPAGAPAGGGTSSGGSSSTGGGGGSVSYRNCTAVRQAGAAPIHRGEPGYGSHLDRDGVACPARPSRYGWA
ncbi:excalibur calcium-binding domain-containing protein [Streptomyces noboritoensis]|uniref:Excalibur calcium-binding domain-containing protein n=1 Tax=Streptomyces noboritoensis TaxID=67337 RepID=A0ABV6TCP5_9ACTN